jgi:hypothetical protein
MLPGLHHASSLVADCTPVEVRVAVTARIPGQGQLVEHTEREGRLGVPLLLSSVSRVVEVVVTMKWALFSVSSE